MGRISWHGPIARFTDRDLANAVSEAIKGPSTAGRVNNLNRLCDIKGLTSAQRQRLETEIRRVKGAVKRQHEINEEYVRKLQTGEVVVPRWYEAGSPEALELEAHMARCIAALEAEKTASLC